MATGAEYIGEAESALGDICSILLINRIDVST